MKALVWMLLLSGISQDPVQREERTFLKGMAEAERHLREDRVEEAKARVARLGETAASGALVWWMFKDRFGRFADLAEALAGKGEEQAARSFLIASADLFAHVDGATQARIGRILKGDREAAFDVVKHGGIRPEACGLDRKDVTAVMMDRLERGAGTESSVLTFQGRTETLTLFRLAAKRFPKSWEVRSRLGDAALQSGRDAEAADAYAASLALTTAPVRADRPDASSMHLYALVARGIDRRMIDGGGTSRLVRLAVSVRRSRGLAAAEEAVAKHEAAAFPLNVADAYYELGSHAKAAPRYRRWLLGHALTEGSRDVVAYGALVARLVECCVKAGRPLDAVLAHRVLLKDYPPPGYRHAGAIRPEDMVAASRAALGDAADRLPWDTMIDALVKAQPPVGPPLKAEVKRHAAAMASPVAAERDRALEALEKRGPRVSPALREHAESETREVRLRVEGLLRRWALDGAEERYRRE